jgi:RNA polymerase sigma-70 factor (ECF subfamily)
MEPLGERTDIAATESLQHQAEQNEREESVRRAVTVLPPRYRDALIVFYFREMDLKETAALLGVSEGTAKAWLHRGRELLRRKLDTRITAQAAVKEVYL